MNKFKSISEFEKYSIKDLYLVKGGMIPCCSTTTTKGTEGVADYDSDKGTCNYESIGALNQALDHGITSGISISIDGGSEMEYRSFLEQGGQAAFMSC